jgi:hypothetical protein
VQGWLKLAGISHQVGRIVLDEPSLRSDLCRWSVLASRPWAHASVGGASACLPKPLYVRARTRLPGSRQAQTGRRRQVLASRAGGWSRESGVGSAGTPRPTMGQAAVDGQVGRIVLDAPSPSSRLCRWGERTREPSPSSDLRRWGVLASRAGGWSRESGVGSAGTPRPTMGPGVGSAGTPRPTIGPSVGSAGTPRPTIGPGVGSAGTPRPTIGPSVGSAGTPRPTMGPSVGSAGTPRPTIGPGVGSAGTPRPTIGPGVGSRARSTHGGPSCDAASTASWRALRP